MAAKTIKLTTGQALIRYLAAQKSESEERSLFAGMWAIFGHGNVAGIGEALYHYRHQFPTFRAHNEQAMAHAAIAFAKAKRRRQMMACTTSIGPGATNMVTAAALAHVNRLPVLLLPGDVFTSRRPDPVLQQLEREDDATASVNDCFRPISSYWDRITRPEQLLTSLPRAIEVLADPQRCGPAILSLCQDVQAESFYFPRKFFEPQVHAFRRLRPDREELTRAVEILRRAKRPLIIAGGGVHYALAQDALQRWAQLAGVPVAETQAGKGALSWDCDVAVGAIGVTGTDAANQLASEADVILAIGTRLQDFTTGSRTLFSAQHQMVSVNVSFMDAAKHGAVPLLGDASEAIRALRSALRGWKVSSSWARKVRRLCQQWNRQVDSISLKTKRGALPEDAQVVRVVNENIDSNAVVVCAAGGLPGELHKLWRCHHPDSYHLEYGYSCMGYEIAGGLGVKMAHPEREVVVMVGDGSYLMMNSEIATSVMLGLKMTIVLLDNRGFGCIHRLQGATVGVEYNNLWEGCTREERMEVDFVAHARSLGAIAEKVSDLGELAARLREARQSPKTHVIVIDTDPEQKINLGGNWWDVAVVEQSSRSVLKKTLSNYQKNKGRQQLGW